ncbi:MAG TPA: serine protease [Candidatus Acidoferrum sp.]|nr:serine protease [Candidatus Acidoferrum sp.]
MYRYTVLFAAVLLLSLGAAAQAPRFVIDDDQYVDRIEDASAKLLHAGKLKSIEALRHQVHTRSFAARLATPSHHQLSPPDLYERLRQSTLTVGSYYKCPDCGEWHFLGAGGFVVSSDGVVCTCCHVVRAEDEGVKESYLVAADAAGHVYPVESVLAADPESDTCLVKINASGLKPLPLRPGVRVGEPIYCLGHPGGYYFMFTQGMVSRLNLRCNDAVDEHGHTNGLLTRPVLLFNMTAEFAPGSSGAPVADEAGNVVGQVDSIAEAGEPGASTTNSPASPSVPIRFCVASEEIIRLTKPYPSEIKQIAESAAVPAAPRKKLKH